MSIVYTHLYMHYHHVKHMHFSVTSLEISLFQPVVTRITMSSKICLCVCLFICSQPFELCKIKSSYKLVMWNIKNSTLNQHKDHRLRLKVKSAIRTYNCWEHGASRKHLAEIVSTEKKKKNLQQAALDTRQHKWFVDKQLVNHTPLYSVGSEPCSPFTLPTLYLPSYKNPLNSLQHDSTHCCLAKLQIPTNSLRISCSLTQQNEMIHDIIWVSQASKSFYNSINLWCICF